MVPLLCIQACAVVRHSIDTILYVSFDLTLNHSFLVVSSGHGVEGRGAGRKRKELAYAVKCQASCWLQIESLMCCNLACPILLSLTLFWPFMKTFNKQYIRNFVHLISLNPHSHALRKILLPPFHKGRSRNSKRLTQGHTVNEWKKLGPNLCSVCSATLCSSPPPSPEITDGIFTLCSVWLEGMLEMGAWGKGELQDCSEED